MKFKAAVLVESKKPLLIEELEIKPLEVGQVLVKLNSSGICGAQINEIDAVKGKDNFLPHLLGHEGKGVVVECGIGVTKVKEEDNVVLHWRQGQGIQSSTPIYTSKTFGNVNAGWVTTFNEYAVVSENRLTPIPENINQNHAALMGCAVTTAFGTINNDANIKVGDSIAIFGCGGVGLSLIQFAKLSGCYPIIGIDIHENKLKHAKSIGATHTFLSNQENFKKLVLESNSGSKIDVCIDNTGIPEIIDFAYNLTSQEGGRTLLVGVMDRKNKMEIWTYPLHFNQEIIGSSGGQCRPDIDIPKIIKLIDNNLLHLDGLISKTYTLDNINDAINDLRFSDHPGRLMLNF